MLLIAQKGIREVICHNIYQYEKANNKYMKHYDKNCCILPYILNYHIFSIGM